MDADKIKNEIKERFSHYLVEAGAFGNGRNPFIWITEDGAAEISRFVRQHPVFLLDWLENFSIVDFGDSYLVSYFLRSRSSDFEIVLRISPARPKGSDLLKIPNLSEFWPELSNYELDSKMLFGVYWSTEKHATENLWAEHDIGFPPLRKQVFL